ncbi:TRAP transporter substrate-binding protein [Ferruginivarius sediminum]|uniref:ABC transporter substrate-binding protein n=1 Tax=Ferruginivarius sediminum TaxID=2661937 RepID=A0A369T8G8_9PROT|nr:TRAP transporter substrate-binding protein [Ferruginivarius sediminum]RDD60645.1 ABC transporter substrate-binding protein [Ferruginivarius sediminum]
MKRRDFMKTAAATTATAGAIAGAGSFPAPAVAQEKRELKMVTTWPKNFPGLGTSAERLAKRITEMSEGTLTVRVFAAGELVPALESIDAVISGTADMSHSAAYYWQGKTKALNFFTGVPYGFTASEISAWIRYMGGQELWDEVYDDFGVKPFMSGQTGVQAGGWFRNELTSLDDLKGLKFRTPGLAGEVWRRLGVSVINLPGGEIYQALQSGRIDAAEFVGPLTDLALGFYKVAQNYYWPSFNEPGLATELAVNKSVYSSLTKGQQEIIRTASEAEYDNMYAEFNARNADSLKTLTEEHGVKVHEFSRELLIAGGKAAAEVIEELRAEGDEKTKKVVESYLQARQKLVGWSKVADGAYLSARLLPFDYARP